MDRVSIINHLIRKNNYKSFCNIGVFTGYTLDYIECEAKIGIDPEPQHYKGSENVFPGTSDEFFNHIDKDLKWDIFFIDGMHLAEYVYRDIENCLKHLNPEGIILLHDINPPTKKHASRVPLLPEWNGDCYKAFIKAKALLSVEAYVIDTDWGVGIMKVSDKPWMSQSMVKHKEAILQGVTWEYFDENRKELLNLISVEEFLSK